MSSGCAEIDRLLANFDSGILEPDLLLRWSDIESSRKRRSVSERVRRYGVFSRFVYDMLPEDSRLRHTLDAPLSPLRGVVNVLEHCTDSNVVFLNPLTGIGMTSVLRLYAFYLFLMGGNIAMKERGESRLLERIYFDYGDQVRTHGVFDGEEILSFGLDVKMISDSDTGGALRTDLSHRPDVLILDYPFDRDIARGYRYGRLISVASWNRRSYLDSALCGVRPYRRTEFFEFKPEVTRVDPAILTGRP